MTVLDRVEAPGLLGRAAAWSGDDSIAPSAAPATGLSLRVLLVTADTCAVLLAWAAARVLAPAGTGTLTWLAAAGVALVTAYVVLAAAGLYRSRVSSVRAIEL